MVNRLNDYFIMYNVRWLNTGVIFQKVNKKEIKKKSCEIKYEELKKMSRNFDIRLLKPNKNYITITHSTIINSIRRIEGVKIKGKVYMYTKNLDKLQYQIYLCKKNSECKKNKKYKTGKGCRIRFFGKEERKFYYIRFMFQDK